MPRGHRLPVMANPHRIGGYPRYADGSFPLLVIYDDNLHNRWSHQKVQFTERGVSWSMVPFEQDDAVDVGRLRGGQRVPCAKSIRATFRHSAQVLMLRASKPMVVANATVPLQLSLAFTHASAGPCDSTPTRGWCNSTACVSLRPHGTRMADTVFVPLCGLPLRQGPRVSAAASPGEEHARRWQQMEVPLERFDAPHAQRSTQLGELLLVPGGESLAKGAGAEQRSARHAARGALPLAPPLVVHLDEVRLSGARPLLAGDFPPAYGRTDMNAVQGGWLHAAPSTGPSSGPSTGMPIGTPSTHRRVCELARAPPQPGCSPMSTTCPHAHACIQAAARHPSHARVRVHERRGSAEQGPWQQGPWQQGPGEAS